MSEEEDVMHEAEVRAKDIRVRLHQDMHTTLVTNGVTNQTSTDALLDALVGDAMFQIEHLLIEVETLHMVGKVIGSVTEPVGWPADD